MVLLRCERSARAGLTDAAGAAAHPGGHAGDPIEVVTPVARLLGPVVEPAKPGQVARGGRATLVVREGVVLIETMLV